MRIGVDLGGTKIEKGDRALSDQGREISFAIAPPRRPATTEAILKAIADLVLAILKTNSG